jgi:hypothetical protein
VINHEFMVKSMPGYRKAFEPHWFATRNFHGQWYADSDRLEALVPFREQSIDAYFAEAPRHMPWIARAVSRYAPGLIHKRIENLAKAPDGSLYWFAHDEKDKIRHYFGSRAAWEAIPRTWDSFTFAQPSREPTLLNHGYDETRSPDTWTLDDLRAAAEFRGAKCLAASYEGPYTPVEWQSAAGHRFSMTPNLYIKGGHWCPATMLAPENYDVEAKRNPFFAQVWTEEAE